MTCGTVLPFSVKQETKSPSIQDLQEHMLIFDWMDPPLLLVIPKVGQSYQKNEKCFVTGRTLLCNKTS